MNKNILKKEIALIKTVSIQDWVKQTLQNTPDYFFTAMASSTGKYHPSCTCCKSGLIVHVKRVVYLVNRLCDGYGIKEIDKDIVLAASILHDIAKTPSNNPKFTYADYENHPINAEKYFAALDNEEIKRKITDCIRYHMGLWTPASIKKDLKDYTLLELIVYTADYIAATKDLVTSVDNKDEIPCQCDTPLKNEVSDKCGNCGLKIEC
jgi:HD superfamily phosphodiesterase